MLKIAKTQQEQVKKGKNLDKNSAKVARIKFCYGTDGSRPQVQIN